MFIKYQGFRFSLSIYLSMSCHACEDRQTTAYMKNTDTS